MERGGLISMKKSHLKHISSFDGATIYYDVKYSNKKYCLVFLHGLGGDLSSWQSTRKFFHDKNISTIAIDLRGHGYSDRSGDEKFYSIMNFAKDVLAIIEKEDFENYILIGHCFGGMIALTFAGIFPNISKLLILVDTSHEAPSFLVENLKNKKLLRATLSTIAKLLPTINKNGHADFSKFRGTQDLDIKRIASDIMHTSLKSYLMICENIIGYDAKKLLNKIKIPTLVIGGTKDSVFPPDVARSLKKRIKNSELNLIPEENHIIVLNNPVALSKTIFQFIIRYQ